MNLTKFLLNKGVIYAIILAVFYQIMMVGLYIYGYHVLPNGVNQLAINVVNQDGDKGAAIEEELTPALSKSFSKVTADKGLDESQKELFKAISYFTPLYPNTQIDFGILFGGPKFIFEIRLLVILITSSLILLLIVWRKWGKTENGKVAEVNKIISKPAADPI